jgi:D-alanyl-D-alanine carboxypeptidase/D-alanyl-D-alanine-endopeptidase (penicillin-binding protein 4)
MKKIPPFPSLLLPLLLLLTMPVISLAQEATAPVREQTREQLQLRLATMLDQPQFAAARLGMRVINSQGAVLFERDADKLFTPASNMKLYTSAAALDAFGPEHRFKTSVYITRQDVRGGTLRSDVILYGRGDPNLSARFENPKGRIDEYIATDKITGVESLADQIKARGITRIVGDLIADDSYFATDGRGTGWEWDDLMFYYGASVSALTVNDNAVTFVVKAARIGQPPVITIRPQTSYLKIINRAMTVAAAVTEGKTRIGVDRPLGTNEVEFFGSIPAGAKDFEVEISVHDPASFAATLLKEALQRRGITLTGQIRRMSAATRLTQPFDETKLIEIASLQSQPLSVLLKVINKPSQNLHTEIMLRHLGRNFAAKVPIESANTAKAISKTGGDGVEIDDYGRPKSSESRGIEAIKEFLARAGVDAAQLSLRDGSGLSRSDLVTPRSTSQLLLHMMSHPHFAAYRESLPVAGVDGTLRNRMKAGSTTGNVRAKTGTLTYVNALSGYVQTKRGQVLIFSLMQNNYTQSGRDVTGLFDQLCNVLADFDGDVQN